MVICKFYRQGNCRYGQYCQFEHVNHFVGGPKADMYNEDDIALIVAKEVLFAERGGQWLLSCFAPLKERPSIPGMEDLSPEEVRWEMYQAQKNGMVEQAKLRFQQLCQDMKAKRDALKNPNRETISMLKKLLGSSQKGSQLSLANSTSASNVFGKQTFGVQSNNSFSGGFSSPSNTSIFGRSNNTTPMFGGTPTFGNNLGFGNTTNTSSIFSGTTNTSTFGAVASQPNPIFGNTSQGIFGQTNVFGGGTSQSTSSAFDSNATSSNSLFNNPMTSQANTPLFGAAQTTTANLFGGSSSNTQTNSVFGATTSSGPFNAGLFSQPKTLPAFGGAPVFGGATNYTSNSGSIFGGQTFGTPAISSNSIFGAAATTTPAFGGSATMTPAFGVSAATTTPVFGVSTSTTTPAFGASVAATAPAFGGTTVTTTPAFGLAQQPVANTFSTPVSTSNVFGAQNTGTAIPVGNAPFGEPVNGPFVTAASSQFGSTSTTSAPFASAGFGLVAAANTSDTFGTAATSSNALFANAGSTFVSANATVPKAFPAPIFGTSPFGIITTMTTMTTTTTMATTNVTNPFAPRTQQSSTPFGGVTQHQLTNSASPFGNTSLAVTITSTIIDDSVYSTEDALTDDEKSMFLAEKFIIGKIPLKPPTKDIK